MFRVCLFSFFREQLQGIPSGTFFYYTPIVALLSSLSLSHFERVFQFLFEKGEVGVHEGDHSLLEYFLLGKEECAYRQGTLHFHAR